MFLMIQLILGVYKDIVQVGYTEIVQVVEQDVVYIPLVGCRSIDKAKREDFALV